MMETWKAGEALRQTDGFPPMNSSHSPIRSESRHA